MESDSIGLESQEPAALRSIAATTTPRVEPEDGGSQPIPEPSTLLLVGTGLVGVALTSRWRRRKATTV